MPRGDPAAGAQQAEGAPAPKKQGLGAALRDGHIARRFFILAYAFLVMCMVSDTGQYGSSSSVKASTSNTPHPSGTDDASANAAVWLAGLFQQYLSVESSLV
jgi:hypothetical protein